MTKQTPKKYVKSKLHPKSFVSNFWGAVQIMSLIVSLFRHRVILNSH